MRLSQALIGAAVLTASIGIAWGVMSARVEAQAATIGAHEVRLGAVERRATATEWMLYRICERVGAQPCAAPGER